MSATCEKHPPAEWNRSKKIFVPVFPFSSSVRSTLEHTRNYKNSRRLVLFRWPSRTARRQYLAFGVHRNANKMPLHTVGVNSDNLCIRSKPYFLRRGQFAHSLRLHFRCSNIIPYFIKPSSTESWFLNQLLLACVALHIFFRDFNF